MLLLIYLPLCCYSFILKTELCKPSYVKLRKCIDLLEWDSLKLGTLGSFDSPSMSSNVHCIPITLWVRKR